MDNEEENENINKEKRKALLKLLEGVDFEHSTITIAHSKDISTAYKTITDKLTGNGKQGGRKYLNLQEIAIVLGVTSNTLVYQVKRNTVRGNFFMELCRLTNTTLIINPSLNFEASMVNVVHEDEAPYGISNKQDTVGISVKDTKTGTQFKVVLAVKIESITAD